MKLKVFSLLFIGVLFVTAWAPASADLPVPTEPAAQATEIPSVHELIPLPTTPTPPPGSVEPVLPAPKPSATPPKAATSVRLGLALQGIWGDTKSSKFEEYRDVPEGLYLRSLGILMENASGRDRLTIGAANLGRRDERMGLEFDDFGTVYAELTFDRVPHVYSNTGKTIFHEQRPGVFVLPSAVQAQLQTIATTDLDPDRRGTQIDTAAFGAVIDELLRPVSLRVDRKTLGFRSAYTPSPELSLFTSYSDETRTGHRPMSTTFGFTNIVELPEPREYRTRDWVLGAEYATKRGAAQLQYDHSSFENDVDALIWSNPISAVDAVDAPAHGRLPLPADNAARNLRLNGAYRFSDSLRLTGGFARGRWEQDEAFLPHTINTALVDPGLALPATRLDGKIDTSLDQLALDFDATKTITLTGRYRRYELDNKTPELFFPASVEADLEIADETENEPPSYTQKNAGLDLVWRPCMKLNLRLTGEEETWDRERRDVKRTRERIFRGSVDWQATDWLLARVGIWRGHRRIRGGYEDPLEFSQLRRFDEADRDRDDDTFMLQLTPEGRWDGAIVWRRLDDNYLHSAYGLRRDKINDISFDWNYDAGARTAVYGGMSFTRIEWRMKSRLRPVVDDVIVDDPLNDWLSTEKDRSDAFWVGATHAIRPNRLTLDASLTYNQDQEKTKAHDVPGGTAGATDWPAVTYRFLVPSVALNYIANPDRKWRLEYRFEKYTERDFQFDVMRSYLPDSQFGVPTGVFLGARTPGYRAHIVTLELEQKF